MFTCSLSLLVICAVKRCWRRGQEAILRNIDQWLYEYGLSHQNRYNQIIHKFAVPVIVVSLLGILWSLPVFWASTVINWASIFAAISLCLYLRLSRSLAVGMLFIVIPILTLFFWLNVEMDITLWPAMVVLFVVSWIFQFIGHLIEGKKPSFLEDLQFLLIGPLWLLAMVYRRFRIKY